MEPESDSDKRTSTIWKLFTKKARFIATCNTCHKDYSYRSSTSNLNKHYRKKHMDITFDNEITDITDGSDEEWNNHSDKETVKQEPNTKSTWQYFDILDSDKFVARCKVCDKDISYETVSDLTDHAKEHDVQVSDDDEYVTANSRVPKRRLKSAVWRYMKIVDRKERSAMCIVCKKLLSYSTSISNLRKHIKRAHPHLTFGSDNESNAKKLLISANGQIYEIETSDGEKDPIGTDEVYLDNTINEETIETYEKSITPPKKKAYTPKKVIKNNIKKELFENIYKNHSSEDDTPNRYNIFNKKSTKMNTLDYFGQYIISLLKELPKQVSDQLQSEIIKQIMTAKIALHTPAYSVTLSDKPVTVTINNSSCNNVPEITVNNNGDVVMTEKNDCNNESENVEKC